MHFNLYCILYVLELPIANEKGLTLIGVILNFLYRTSIINLFPKATVTQLITDVVVWDNMVNQSRRII